MERENWEWCGPGKTIALASKSTCCGVNFMASVKLQPV